jgi:hypothetical protein
MKSFKKTARMLALVAGPALAAMMATPASASQPVTCNPGSLSIFSPAASTCVGYYSGNVLDNSSADVTTQTNALAALGLTFTNFNDYTNIGLTGGSSTTIDFGTVLSGLTVIGVHWGNVPDSIFNPHNRGNVGNVTAFLEFNLTSPISSIDIVNNQGISGAVLYQTGTPGVPEPATWAMMILGFGAAGVAMRRRKRTLTSLPQLA